MTFSEGPEDLFVQLDALHEQGGSAAFDGLLPTRQSVQRTDPVDVAAVAPVLEALMEQTSAAELSIAPDSLVDIAAAVCASQLVLFAGPSGTGKSTAARLMSEFFVPESSRAVLDARRQLMGPEDIAGFLSPISEGFARGIGLPQLLRLSGGSEDVVTPILLVEEINLSPVEGYLAPLTHALSGLSTARVDWRLYDPADPAAKNVHLPHTLELEGFPRLFGTINVDATAHAPAPKVAARACVLLLEPQAEPDVAEAIKQTAAGAASQGADGLGLVTSADASKILGNPLAALASMSDPDRDLVQASVEAVLGFSPKLTVPPALVTRRQLGQMASFVAWYTLFARSFEQSAGHTFSSGPNVSLDEKPFRLGAEAALLHFVLPSLSPHDFSAVLSEISNHLEDMFPPGSSETELGGVLRSRIERLQGADGPGLSSRHLDFWDRLS